MAFCGHTPLRIPRTQNPSKSPKHPYRTAFSPIENEYRISLSTKPDGSVITKTDVGQTRKRMANPPYPLGGHVILKMSGTSPPMIKKLMNHGSNGHFIAG